MTFVCTMYTYPVLGFCGKAEMIYPHSRAICYGEVISVQLLKQYTGTSTYGIVQSKCEARPSPPRLYCGLLYRPYPTLGWEQCSTIDDMGRN